MGREKDPFHGRWHSQNRRRRGHNEDEYDLYEDELEYEEYDEDDEFEVEDDFDEKGSNVSRRRSAPSLPPFPSTPKNIYPRRSRTRRTPESATPRPPIRPTQTNRPKRQAYLPDEPLPPGRRSTGSYQQRPSEQRTRTRTDSPIPPPSATLRRVPSKPRKRRVWPIFLVGCASGAVSLVLFVAIVVLMVTGGFSSLLFKVPIKGLTSEGKAIAGKSDTQTVPLSALSQLIVCDAAGNVSLGLGSDPNATNAVVTTTKTALHAVDQNDADQKLSQVSVSVQAQPSGEPLTCEKLQASSTSTSNATPTTIPTATNNAVLSVNVIFPPDQADQVATVDVTIMLPKSVVQSFTSTLISVPEANGNISIDGVSGRMDIHNSSGDIIVKNGILVDGSKLQAQGKLTFNGLIWSTATPPNKRASLFFGGAYLVDLTLLETTSVMIDATANTRTSKITSDFPIHVVTNTDGSSTYYGPFNPAIPTDENAAARLTLQASSGNISMHKAQAPQGGP